MTCTTLSWRTQSPDVQSLCPLSHTRASACSTSRAACMRALRLPSVLPGGNPLLAVPRTARPVQRVAPRRAVAPSRAAKDDPHRCELCGSGFKTLERLAEHYKTRVHRLAVSKQGKKATSELATRPRKAVKEQSVVRELPAQATAANVLCMRLPAARSVAPGHAFARNSQLPGAHPATLAALRAPSTPLCLMVLLSLTKRCG